MSATHDTVSDRLAGVTTTLTPTQFALIVGLIATGGFALLFMQEPLVHDSLHNFRHSIGVTCH